ncbi:hypothetical protein HPB50_014409 [Hyalomma asiaticum]|uniref:Uncharacterized protein n=1 Tax=Hyalomma asiaticum TaxID=266040 RepID=A0ACB7S0D1_HYAAI|nr:hypothetical protein HPB50_014409 [Hyalomma asiaticum]
MRFFSGVGVLLLVLLAGKHASSSSHYLWDEKGRLPLHFVERWLKPNSELVFLSCDSSVEPAYQLLTRNISKRVTLWQCCKKEFYETLEANRLNNVRTVVVVLGKPDGKISCVRKALHEPSLMILIEWIIFNEGNETLTSPKDLLTFDADFPACREGGASSLSDKEADGLTSTPGVTVVSRRCPQQGDGDKTRTFAMRNKLVHVGCMPRLGEEGKTTCAGDYLKDIFAALRQFNTTPIFIHYSGYRTAVDGLVEGYVDILLILHKASLKGLKLFDYPGFLEYRNEAFYTKRMPHSEESSFAVLVHSRDLFVNLSLVMLAAVIVMSAQRYIELGRDIVASLSDSAMFLISSFLATYSPCSTGSRRRSAFRTVCSRNVITIIWLFGMLPLSNYMRGELISRMAVLLPPNHLDTLDELEQALDQGKLTPCLFNGESFPLPTGSIRSASTLQQKLTLSIQRNQNRSKAQQLALSQASEIPTRSEVQRPLEETSHKTNVRLSTCDAAAVLLQVSQPLKTVLESHCQRSTVPTSRPIAWEDPASHRKVFLTSRDFQLEDLLDIDFTRYTSEGGTRDHLRGKDCQGPFQRACPTRPRAYSQYALSSTEGQTAPTPVPTVWPLRSHAGYLRLAIRVHPRASGAAARTRGVLAAVPDHAPSALVASILPTLLTALGGRRKGECLVLWPRILPTSPARLPRLLSGRSGLSRAEGPEPPCPMLARCVTLVPPRITPHRCQLPASSSLVPLWQGMVFTLEDLRCGLVLPLQGQPGCLAPSPGGPSVLPGAPLESLLHYLVPLPGWRQPTLSRTS